MTERDEPLVGKIVEQAKNVTAAEAFSAVKQIVEIAREFVAEHDEQVTKRQQLHTYEVTEVARIKAAETTLRNYFDLVFAERRAIYQELFARMDRALDERNNEVLHSVVIGIVDLAKTSPLAELGDLSKFRAAWDDPNKVHEL
jgi:hypothetical protein